MRRLKLLKTFLKRLQLKQDNFTRVKGLGEFNDDQVKEFLLNKEKRHTLTVEYPSDLEEFNNIMGTSEYKRGLLTGLGLLQE